MPTIRKYEGSRGVRYRAIVRKAGHAEQSKTFATKKAAQEWARELERNADLGLSLPNAQARRRTLADVFDVHMESDTGRDRSKAERLLWWRGQIGGRRLSEVNKAVIADCLDTLEREPQMRRVGKRSPATVNRYLTTISAALQEAVRRDWLAENPARKIKRRREDSTRHRYLNDDERPALLAACRDAEAPVWLYPLVIAALGTGARRGELLKLRWRDVSLDRGRAYLGQTKSGKPRSLVLLGAVVEALRDWGTVRDLRDDRVFPLKSYYSLDRPWRDACARAGITEPLRFHDLRHSCASYMAQNGANLQTIMQALGHTSLAATQRYQHLLDHHVADAMADALDGKLS